MSLGQSFSVTSGDIVHALTISLNKCTVRPQVESEGVGLAIQFVSNCIGIVIPFDKQEEVPTSTEAFIQKSRDAGAHDHEYAPTRPLPGTILRTGKCSDDFETAGMRGEEARSAR